MELGEFAEGIAEEIRNSVAKAIRRNGFKGAKYPSLASNQFKVTVIENERGYEILVNCQQPIFAKDNEPFSLLVSGDGEVDEDISLKKTDLIERAIMKALKNNLSSSGEARMDRL